MRTNKWLPCGVYSEGTLRTKDLLETFWPLLRERLPKRLHRRNDPDYALRSMEADMALYHMDPALVTRPLGDLLDEVIQRLDAYLPPYTFLGGHPGDGALWGVWPLLLDEVTQHETDMPVVSDLGHLPPKYVGDVLLVNDHGNVTCGHITARNKWTTYWSVV